MRLRMLRAALALLALVAIGSQLTVSIRIGASIVNFFSYFTNLSNLVAAAVLLTTALAAVPSLRTTRLRAFSTTNMAVVGIAFSLLLRHEDLGPLRPWVNFVLHYLMPLAVVLDWLLDPPSVRLLQRDLLSFLGFPAVYLVYSLVRGAYLNWYPYPFLNPQRVDGYPGVATYALGIAVLFVVVGEVLLAVGNAMHERRKGFLVRP